MLFQPAIIALLLAAGLAVLMLAGAAPFAVQVIRHWDIGSGSERQLALERRTYLFSTLLAFVLVAQLAALLLRPKEAATGPLGRFFAWFNRSFEKVTHGYVNVSGAAIRRTARSLLLLAGLGAIGLGLAGIVRLVGQREQHEQARCAALRGEGAVAHQPEIEPRHGHRSRNVQLGVQNEVHDGEEADQDEEQAVAAQFKDLLAGHRGDVSHGGNSESFVLGSRRSRSHRRPGRS